LIKIYARDHIIFDELNLEPPAAIIENTNAILAAKKEDDVALPIDDKNICKGNSCCSTTTMWNPAIKQCVKLVDGFSSIHSVYGDMIINKQPRQPKRQSGYVTSFSGSENYSKI
jgi:hypothetical protein